MIAAVSMAVKACTDRIAIVIFGLFLVTTTPLGAAELTEARESVRVDHSITAAKIAENPAKYLWRYVELACAVDIVVPVGDTWAAFSTCGSAGDRAAIVVAGNRAKSFYHGQKIRFIGQVAEGVQKTDAVVRYDYAR